MNLSRKWLTEFVDVGLDEINDHDFAEAMTMTGSKVEGTRYMGEGISRVVVGRIVEMVRHHDSDHMWTCQVDVGGERNIQIVTGAQNQKVGDMVPVALDGSRLPGGAEIHTTVFRGELSEGMMCSLKELGLTQHDFPYAIEDGLFVLQEDCRPGDDIVPVIGRDDHVVEFEITPNRPDCLSVIGLAREASVTFKKPLRLHTPVVKGSGGDINDYVRVDVEDPRLCPRYTARMVRNIKIEPSPKWMRERIAAMKNNGVIRGFTTIIDAKAYNKMAAVFLEVEVEPTKIDKVALKLLENQDIAIVAQNTGTVGLHVHAYIESVDKLSSFLDECIYSIDGVKSVNSSLLIRQYRTTAWLASY